MCTTQCRYSSTVGHLRRISNISTEKLHKSNSLCIFAIHTASTFTCPVCTIFLSPTTYLGTTQIVSTLPLRLSYKVPCLSPNFPRPALSDHYLGLKSDVQLLLANPNTSLNTPPPCCARAQHIYFDHSDKQPFSATQSPFVDTGEE